jgi:hypothetical protein
MRIMLKSRVTYFDIHTYANFAQIYVFAEGYVVMNVNIVIYISIGSLSI